MSGCVGGTHAYTVITFIMQPLSSITQTRGQTIAIPRGRASKHKYSATEFERERCPLHFCGS